MQGKEYINSPLKRNFDLLFAPALLLTTSPIFLAVYLDNLKRHQSTFFSQERIGKDGRPFYIKKFETMYAGAEQEPEHLRQLNLERQERDIYDPRVQHGIPTLIRRLSLNELPQSLNIIKREMSFVGPRPIVPECLTEAERLFPNIMVEWKRTAQTILPGLLGVAPLKTRKVPIWQFDKAAEEDIGYYYNASFAKDVLVILQALKAIKQSANI